MNRTRTLLAVAVALLVFANCTISSKSASSASSPTGSNSHFAKFGTNKIHYVTSGSGSHTVLFVHCWAGNLGFWREQVPALDKTARLILVDLPGHGQSDKPQTQYTMDLFARAVLTVMGDARVDKAVLVGHSMGVAVICRVYQHAPEKVVALVAVDGLLRRPQLEPSQAEEFTGPFRATGYREHTSRFIGAMFPHPGTEALRERVLSEILATPQHVMSGAMDGMFGAGQPDWDLKKVPVPVLVISANNPMWTDEYKEYVRSLSSRTRFRTIDGAGHWLMLEKPAEFNAALKDDLIDFNLIAK